MKLPPRIHALIDDAKAAGNDVAVDINNGGVTVKIDVDNDMYSASWRRTKTGRLRLVMCTDEWTERMSLAELRSFCCR